MKAEKPHGPIDWSKEYLDIEDILARVPYGIRAIEEMMREGTWLEGLHYRRPRGPGKKRIFFWSAIEAWIRGDDYELRRKHLENQNRKKRASGRPSTSTTEAVDFETHRRELQGKQ